MVTEHFGAVINLAVAIEIPNKETFVFANPAAVFNFLITIKIKMDVAIGTDGFNFAISV